ncbi:sensor histidine kinase [Paenibacillus koleovorans]|uniref:sensor histidine kinase n=1 Tax=Paenibacillus koleovorans TaxID=121608 RepID=UPI000FDB6482|nr:sensor histidine kinase [Paenibacillus koleovorans]
MGGRKIKLSNFLMLFSLAAVLIILLSISTLFYYKMRAFVQEKLDHIQSIKVSQIQFDIAGSFNDAYNVMNHLRTNERFAEMIDQVEENTSTAAFDRATMSNELETLLFNLKKDNPFLRSILVQSNRTQYSSSAQYTSRLPEREPKEGESPVLLVNKGQTYRFFGLNPDAPPSDSRTREALDTLNGSYYLWSPLIGRNGGRLGSAFVLLDGDYFRQHIPYSEHMALLDAGHEVIFAGDQVNVSALARLSGLQDGTYKPGQLGLSDTTVTIKRLAPYELSLIYEENVSIHRAHFTLILKLIGFIFTACTLLSFAGSRIVAGAMLQPLLRFLKQMKSYDSFGDRPALPVQKRSLSLHTRFFLYFAVTILFPVLLFIGAFYTQSMRIVGDELRDSYSTVFHNTVHRIELFIEQKSVSLARLSYDTYIRRLIMNETSESPQEIASWIRQNEYLGISRDIVSIYDLQERLIFSNFYPPPDRAAKPTEGGERSRGLSYELETDRSGASYIRLGMPIFNLYGFPQRIGLIRLDINSLFLSNLYADFKENNSSAYIVDEHRTIVSHSSMARIGRQDESDATDNEFRFAAKLPHLPWQFVSEFDASAVKEQTIDLMFDDLSIVLILLLLAVIFAFGMSRYLIHPFHKLGLVLPTRQAGLTDRDPLARAYGIEEVDQLSRTYTRMLDRIEALVEESLIANHRRLRSEYEKRESQLLALQAQINPHFLYNTLESLVYAVEKQENDKAVVMIHSLSRLFRYMTSHDRTIVSMREECEYAQAFVHLIMQRYHERVECRWHLDKELDHCGIIKLVLQPIVENVFYHGVPQTQSKIVIDIRTTRQGEHIRIEVSDNAKGIPADQLKAIRQRLQEHDGSGIGIYNVNKRIKLHYGEAYGLEIESEEGAGTTVSITIPRL